MKKYRVFSMILIFAFLGDENVGAGAKKEGAKKLASKANPLIVREFAESADNSVGSLAISPDNTWLVQAGPNEDEQHRRVVAKWDVFNGKLLARFALDAKGSLSFPCVSPNGKVFAVCDQESNVFVCDANNGKLIFTYRQWESGGTGILFLTFLDDQHVLSVDGNSVGQKRNIRDGKTWIYQIGGPSGVARVAITRRKDRLVYLIPQTFLVVVGGDLKQDILSFNHNLKAIDPVLGVTDDGAFALASDDFVQLALYDLNQKKLVRRWQGHNTGKAEGLVNGIMDIVSLQQKRVFITSDFLGYVRFWNTSGQQLAEVRCPQRVSLAVSPDNKFLATRGPDQPITLWDLERILAVKR